MRRWKPQLLEKLATRIAQKGGDITMDIHGTGGLWIRMVVTHMLAIAIILCANKRRRKKSFFKEDGEFMIFCIDAFPINKIIIMGI